MLSHEAGGKFILPSERKYVMLALSRRAGSRAGPRRKDVTNPMGMTDLQFKSWLKQIIRGLEDARNEESKEMTDRKIDNLIKDLREDLQG